MNSPIIYNYNYFGLLLKCAWELPFPGHQGSHPPLLGEVELARGPASFFAAIRHQAGPPSEPGSWYQYTTLPDGSIYLCWPQLFEFLISADGGRITCRSLQQDNLEAFSTYLLAPVLAFALAIQGIESLHCTGVQINQGVVGFVGDCGYGKSSLAAALLKAGYPLVTDDLLVLREEGEVFWAYPAPPRIKLYPGIAAALLGDGFSGTPMNPFTEKLVIPLDARWTCQTPMPLKTFFVLRPSKSGLPVKRVTIRSISKRRACIDLIANIFNIKITEPNRQMRLLAWTSKLANHIPVRSLSYPRELSFLPGVVDAILRNLARGWQ